MSVTRVHVALFVALASLLGVTLWRRPASIDARSAPPHGDRALAILLPGAALLATVDVEALGGTPWGRAGLARLAALARPSTQDSGCAERQLRTIRRVALALPFGPSKNSGVELALFAEGAFEAPAVMACATALTKARGGEPAAIRVNEFSVLRDRRGTGELAVKDGGPLILSGGDYFRDLIEREAGGADHEPGISEKVHLALRARAGAPPLLATWVLPPGWLERWLSDPELGKSPLGLIRAIVVRGEAGRELAIHIRLSTETDADAQRLEPFVRRFGTGATAFLSGGAAPPPTVTRERETIVAQLTSEGFELARFVAALSMFGESSDGSHALDRADPEQLEPEAERAAGGRTQ